ncbi:tetraacyldisaccharide 4'-kinase [Marinagarivorans algicola]|uniref:tetraacyldisaccharide 4'-kinase n=1 Tax=Marinagarivorans algicola TaxID=1513270 RepID=UPI0006B52755|nr:tetraacyldisaccharide 4'-kinase [Marinagarivorans algicola]
MSRLQKIQHSVERQWYSKPTWLYALAPLSGVFLGVSRLRKKYQQHKAYKAACPVIVVGNIAVGGTGKTPVIIALAKALKDAGFMPGIVSRGYGASMTTDGLVHALPFGADAHTYGDEPVLIAQKSDCPVWIATDRVAAVKAAEYAGCNVILADDGLQHYKMGRSFELVVQDANRGTGNGWCLPVGPLRELPERLNSVDYVLNNSSEQSELASSNNAFSLKPAGWVNVKTGLCQALTALPWRGETGTKQRVLAVAGIGNPARFFKTLQRLEVFFKPQSFPDHHAFSAQDFALANGLPVVMTAKDAIKCQHFAEENWWYLSVEADLPQDLLHRIIQHCEMFESTKPVIVTPQK